MDLRESFPILEDIDNNNEGAAPSKAVAGDTPVGRSGLMVLAFRDSAGNLVLPQLDAEGRLPVTQDAAGTPLKVKGELAAGSNVLAAITGAELTLVASKTYVKVAATVLCTIETLFQIIQSDNAVETVIAEILVGPGQYTFSWQHAGLEVVAGGTGVQKLLIKGMNLGNKVSSMRANLSVVQVA